MSAIRTTLGLPGWLALSLAAGWVGSRFRPDDWYEQLTKPAWTPPDAVFAPVWTILYLLMGIAAWLVWRKADFKETWPSLLLFVFQLGLNTFWSFLFFGLHRIDLALLEIILLWIVILITLLLFWRQDPRAGMLLLPYWLWVAYAGALNTGLWILN